MSYEEQNAMPPEKCPHGRMAKVVERPDLGPGWMAALSPDDCSLCQVGGVITTWRKLEKVKPSGPFEEVKTFAQSQRDYEAHVREQVKPNDLSEPLPNHRHFLLEAWLDELGERLAKLEWADGARLGVEATHKDIKRHGDRLDKLEGEHSARHPLRLSRAKAIGDVVVRVGELEKEELRIGDEGHDEVIACRRRMLSDPGSWRLVLLESPFRGNVKINERYARAAMFDCLQRGEAPMVSHLLYTQVLDDCNSSDRKQGMAAGRAWMRVVAAVVVYIDLGWSSGMTEAVHRATDTGTNIEIRELGPGWERKNEHDRT